MIKSTPINVPFLLLSLLRRCTLYLLLSGVQWLNYAEPMHRLREFGCHVKEIDLLDEAKLSLEQVRVICGLLFDVPPR